MIYKNKEVADLRNGFLCQNGLELKSEGDALEILLNIGNALNVKIEDIEHDL